MLLKRDLFELLIKIGLEFEIHNHKPLLQLKIRNLRGEILGAHTKNLFLKNKKNDFFLFSCDENAKVDLALLNQLMLKFIFRKRIIP